MPHSRLALWLSALLPFVALHAAAPPPPRLPAPAKKRIDFTRDIQPLLATFCIDCHGPSKQKGGLRLDSRAAALKAEVLLPGNSGKSALVHRIVGLGREKRMPPKGPGLTTKQIALVRAWIDQKAPWPAVTTLDPTKKHWAYQPLQRPALPSIKNSSWVRNPVDTFILARLEKAGLDPSPEADRRILIRRLSFDLLGLPPTPAQIAHFLNDKRPGAYERLVDRLLASPAHGERYARHWLDVIHFAETHGHDQDVPRDNAWPYRDYLIRFFNADRPYARFIREQVAGDILSPDHPDGIAAVGMLAAGPWDESSLQSIRDDTLDKKQAQNIDRDDMVTTVMTAFTATTVHCARCHDHKFDPVSQDEYYSLQSVFAGVDRANRPYDPDPRVHKQRLTLKRERARLLNAPIKDLLTPENSKAVIAWEKARGTDIWRTLTLDKVACANGSAPTTLKDGSVRFGGKRPDKDVYTLTATSEQKHLTAIRLEVLTDDLLPHKGPGRQDNGNLHLNEITIHAAPKGDASKRQPVVIRSASADFNQAGWTIAHAIDKNQATAWGIYPAVGRAHQAVFVFDKPIDHKEGIALTIALHQTHGGGHLIGRLRLTATSATNPTNIKPLTDNLVRLLAIDATKRTPAQRAELIRHVLLAKIDDQEAALPARREVFAAASDFKPVGSFRPAKGCRPVFVLKRGEITRPLTQARPGALSCVPNLSAAFSLIKPDDEGARRVALAKWLSDDRNVLTWRTMVNRVWHYHFGRGLCATPGDIGRMGARPTHPELLDWLAAEFRDQGGSLKALHRLIVTSATYRQACRHEAKADRLDRDNLLLWRANRTRLDAESVRDSLLAVSGRLDRVMGGPSVKHFVQSPGIHVTPKVDYLAQDLDRPGMSRRSVYRFIFRTLPDPLMDVLDCPDASQFTSARATSITALQALALLNDRFVVRQAEHFAARLKRDSATIEGQLKRAYLLAYGREIRDRELKLLLPYTRKHGLPATCRLLVNANEFVFVD